MSEKHRIAAEIRDDVGKGASRRLRKLGRIPAVLYGAEKEPVALTLEHREVMHAAEEESFFSTILEIKVEDGRTQDVVVRDMQRHPYKRQIMHMDFMRVSATTALRMDVPIHFTGEAESPAGKAAGVVIQHLVTEVEVSALPKDLPEYLEVDLSELEPGDAVHLSDVILPEGVRLPSLTDDEDSDVMVANAIHISEDQGTGAAAAAEAEALAEEEEELLEGEEAEGEEGEEGEESEGEEGEDEEEEDRE